MLIADEIIGLFAAKGNSQYGEDVTQLEHALQCAQHARNEGAPDELVVAALLHDIGHLVTDLPEDAADHGIDDRHEEMGVRYLRQHFPETITEPVRLHVEAKRYLCATVPGYLNALSDASRKSLELQGGVMNAVEVTQFEANPHYAAAVRLRGWDDRAKDPELHPADLDAYRDLLGKVAVGD
jgi:phosphonate degradation associated HDIG domain protein